MPTAPLTRALSQDNLRVRELLETVARDLEAISARERYAEHTHALLMRAMRIRRHLGVESVTGNTEGTQCR